MRYVYLLESDASPGRRYVGLTTDLKRRLLGTPSWRRRFRSTGRPVAAHSAENVGAVEGT